MCFEIIITKIDYIIFFGNVAIKTNCHKKRNVAATICYAAI